MADNKYLDKTGLSYFWSKIKNLLDNKVSKDGDKVLSTNDYTTPEKTKLSNISTEANKVTVTQILTGGTEIAKITIDGSDTSIYTSTYTLPEAGTDLGGVKTGGNVTISNGIISVDDNSHNHTIANVAGLSDALGGKVDVIDGKGLSTNDYTTEEKQKLASILNPMQIKGRVDTVSKLPTSATVGWVYLVGLSTDSEFKEYVYTEDKKWEFIGYNTITVDSTLDTSSSNPVQNSVITTAINGKANSSDLSSHTGNKSNPHSVTASQVGLGNVTNNKQVKGLASGTTTDHIVTWGSDGYTVKDSGFTIGTSVPAGAKFTDTDTKVNVSTSTAKNYILGTTTSPTATATGNTAVANTNVYITNGTLTATKFSGDGSSLTNLPIDIISNEEIDTLFED